MKVDFWTRIVNLSAEFVLVVIAIWCSWKFDHSHDLYYGIAVICALLGAIYMRLDGGL